MAEAVSVLGDSGQQEALPCSRSGAGVSGAAAVWGMEEEERCHYLVLLLIVLSLLRASKSGLSFGPQTSGFLGGRGCQMTTTVPQLKETIVGSPGSSQIP